MNYIKRDNRYRQKTNRSKFSPIKMADSFSEGVIQVVPNSLRLFNFFKSRLVSRLFWERSSYYKNLTHTIIIMITVIFVIGGLVYRITSNVSADNKLDGDGTTLGLDDYLQQGGSIETVLVTQFSGIGLNTEKYIVQPGDTLETIANKHGVTMDTIRWASSNVLNPFTNQVEIGMVLTIPEINGVLYEVKSGDSIDSIINIASLNNDEANKFNIEQFNNLVPPYELRVGQKLFIPDGNLKGTGVGAMAEIPRGVFSNPLADASCYGYTLSRGMLPYHNGLDLAKYPGCPISAVANGVVIYAGWSPYGEGYNVKIDHGGGIVTHYYHGEGTFWVKEGDRVQQGQQIMMMGTTGNSTGIHLHFSLFKDGIAVDPSPYVPY